MNRRHLLATAAALMTAMAAPAMAQDEPLKINDHTVDALRYALFGVEGASYFSPSDLS